ncbi:Appr-1-p processing protein [Actinoplanes sp. SE50]|uniref:macro domain-containing protein n=1 Tax=unclassified Actinoplanes TaxID=2626549 RepID=UPI00023EC6AD|nr:MULTISPECIES: macro domain-containing protein [unclassified Actinoplanes]AEV86454.1 ADP-ribose 1''-phosphate phosphatase [Actinoplanes sp. SE50/110]ATO84852.1 Appr-1-p processing protein [Actinoplanes sp. SE50]SLM02261.1 Appr-1-p processing protein [Actinoplanes sp. SE50/110]
MLKLSFVEGDATAPAGSGPRIIAHVCNDIGAWGAGIVRTISRRWPGPERMFRAWHASPGAEPFRLGAVQLVPVEPELWVANMIVQHGIATRRGLRTGSGHERDAGPPVRYEAIRECLATLAVHARTHRASVHMPRIGCGLAGGVWSEIEPLIEETLGAADIPTVIYDLR